MRSHPFLAFCSFLALAGVIFSSCKKQPEPPPAAAAAAAPKEAPPPSVVQHAAKLGFAAHLPKDTEFYLGSIGLKGHLEALKKTTYWKEFDAFVQDKTPAPSAEKGKESESMKSLLGDDIFLAFLKGSSQSLQGLKEFSEMYSEVSYRALMSGGALAAATGGLDMQPDRILMALADDPKMLEQAAGVFTRFEIPSLALGFKVKNPEKALMELALEEKIAGLPGEATVSDMTTALGGKFKVVELPMSALLTDKMEQELIAQLDATDEAKATITKAIQDIQAKTITFAFGSAGGHVIFATGSAARKLQWVENPAESMLARPEMEFALPYVEKNLAALVYADASVSQALMSERPLQPILRGLVSGLKSSEMFADLANQLEPKLADLGEAEARVYRKKFTNGVAVSWWDKGLHYESTGGAEFTSMDGAKPLKFAPLMEDGSVIFGLNYHATPEFSASMRSYFEKWASLVHFVAQELIKSGLGGEEGGQMFAMLDQSLIPSLVSFYTASKDIYQNALGSEHAVVMDLGGKMAPLPGVTPNPGENVKMLRVAGVHDVVNRPLIDQGWQKMQGALVEMLNAAPLPLPIGLPSVMSSDKNGITTYFYPLPFMSEDMMPCTSVNNQLFILGSSKNLAESIAARLGENAKPGAPGIIWKLDFRNLREFVKTTSSVAPDPGMTDSAASALQWLAPFELLQGRSWLENGKRRDALHWEMHDVRKYD